MKWTARFRVGFGVLAVALLLAGSLAATAHAAPLLPVPQESSVLGQMAPAQASGQMEEFQGLEDRWSLALVHGDQYAMELLLSPYFMNIDSTGTVDTHDQFLAFLFAKDSGRPYSLEQKVVSVRSFGDTAIVSGTYLSKLRVEGVPTERDGIFTHVFVRNDERWLCVNAQQTGVVNEPLSALKQKKEPKKKRSHAELPFHLPF